MSNQKLGGAVNTISLRIRNGKAAHGNTIASAFKVFKVTGKAQLKRFEGFLTAHLQSVKPHQAELLAGLHERNPASLLHTTYDALVALLESKDRDPSVLKPPALDRPAEAREKTEDFNLDDLGI